MALPHACAVAAPQPPQPPHDQEHQLRHWESHGHQCEHGRHDLCAQYLLRRGDVCHPTGARRQADFRHNTLDELEARETTRWAVRTSEHPRQREYKSGTTRPDRERTPSQATIPCVATTEGFSGNSMAATTSRSRIQDVKRWNVSASIWKERGKCVREYENNHVRWIHPPLEATQPEVPCEA